MAGAWLDAADTIVTALTTTALAAASPPPPSPPPTARAAPHRPPPPSPPPTWQVAYDLDASGISLAEFDVGKGAASPPRRHYEAWLDYAYYTANSLRLAGYQESLSEERRHGESTRTATRCPTRGTRVTTFRWDACLSGDDDMRRIEILVSRGCVFSRERLT